MDAMKSMQWTSEDPGTMIAMKSMQWTSKTNWGQYFCNIHIRTVLLYDTVLPSKRIEFLAAETCKSFGFDICATAVSEAAGNHPDPVLDLRSVLTDVAVARLEGRKLSSRIVCIDILFKAMMRLNNLQISSLCIMALPFLPIDHEYIIRGILADPVMTVNRFSQLAMDAMYGFYDTMTVETPVLRA